MYTIFNQFFDYLRYRSAVNKADKAHEETGGRYYVMPSSGYDRKLLIMDRSNFRKLKQKGYINRNANQRDLLQECFYCTAYRNGDGYLDDKGRKVKLQLYFSWCKVQRMLKKEKNDEKRKKKDGKRM